MLEDVTFNTRDTLAAAAIEDGHVLLFNTHTKKQVATLDTHTDDAAAVAFSHDGTHLATASSNGTALIRHLVLTPKDACHLIENQITRDQLIAALSGTSPHACTNLKTEPDPGG
jgi:WD40 repeat protein